MLNSTTTSPSPTYRVGGVEWSVIAPGFLRSSRTPMGRFEICSNPRLSEWNVAGPRYAVGFSSANAAARFVARIVAGTV